VRNLGPPSEITRLAAPIARVLDQTWQRMPWWVATMAVLYALSGITVVKPDEVAVILRWGRLVGDAPGLQAHGPGLLFAFPRPVDQVVRVQVKRVFEVPVTTLAAVGEDSSSGYYTIDPLTQGYALTGDQNIVHVEMVARYRIRDPAEAAFYGAKAEDVMRVEVTAAMVRSLGEMTVDRVLADGRKDLVATASRRAQEGLDRSQAGLELSSLELTRLAPPTALAADFDAVQSSYINAETRKKDAQAYAERVIPGAQSEANGKLQTARGETDAALAKARGEAATFLALAKEYRANVVVVRERLYRDSVEQAIRSAGKVQWVPPPTGGGYHGFRITIPRAPASLYSTAKPPSSASPPAADDDEQ
jgi:membrane protease subunit HflK